MNIFTSIKRTAAVFAILLPLAMPGLTGVAHAAQIPYDPNGTPTTKTPVFNQFTGVPDGVGNEADFVRIRPQSASNSALVTTLNSACNNNDAYTVWNYIHNGADPSFNDNGNGSAVAHGVSIHMTAPLGSTTNSFPFTSTISANNAASVTATAHLNCSQNVTLSLVHNSVHYITAAHGTIPAPDSAVNGDLSIDGHVAGKDDVWACWEERVAVFYDVKVTVTPPPVSSGECKLVDVVTGANRKVTATIAPPILNNATVVGYEINWGDKTPVSHKQTDSHTYANDGTFTIVTKVQIKFADGHTEWKTAVDCQKQVTFKGGTPVTPPTPSTTLVDTGAGSVTAVFAAFSIAGAMAYRVFMARRLNRQ